jgi:hypothetical protein
MDTLESTGLCAHRGDLLIAPPGEDAVQPLQSGTVTRALASHRARLA